MRIWTHYSQCLELFNLKTQSRTYNLRSRYKIKLFHDILKFEKKNSTLKLPKTNQDTVILHIFVSWWLKHGSEPCQSLWFLQILSSIKRTVLGLTNYKKRQHLIGYYWILRIATYLYIQKHKIDQKKNLFGSRKNTSVIVYKQIHDNSCIECLLITSIID